MPFGKGSPVVADFFRGFAMRRRFTLQFLASAILSASKISQYGIMRGWDYSLGTSPSEKNDLQPRRRNSTRAAAANEDRAWPHANHVGSEIAQAPIIRCED